MDRLLPFALVALTTVFTIVDPIALPAPFLAMTQRLDAKEKAAIALRATLVALGVLVVFAAAGTLVFDLFGITLPAFRIAGGILLFLVALDMIRGTRSPTKSTADDADPSAPLREDVAVIPLAIPLISGPGAIASVIVLTGRAQGVPQHAVVYASIALTCAAAYLTMRLADRMSRVLGPIGMNVLTRLMGLLLAAIAVQFVVDGARAALAVLPEGVGH